MEMTLALCPRTLNLLRIACESMSALPDMDRTGAGLEARYDYATLTDLLFGLERASHGDHREHAKYTWDLRHNAEHIECRSHEVARRLRDLE